MQCSTAQNAGDEDLCSHIVHALYSQERCIDGENNQSLITPVCPPQVFAELWGQSDCYLERGGFLTTEPGTNSLNQSAISFRSNARLVKAGVLLRAV
jgi:hypothetical protein